MSLVLTADGEYKLDRPLLSTYGAGSVNSAAGASVVPKDRGASPAFQTKLAFTALEVAIGNAGSGAGFGSKRLYDFPPGYIEVRDVNAYFRRITFNTAAGSDAAIGGGGSGDYSLGSSASADATLAGTDVDLLGSTAMLDPFVTGVGTSNAWARLAAAAVFNGSSTPLSMYLNVIIDDADVTDLSVTTAKVFFTGYVKFTWLAFGDNDTNDG